MDPCSCPSVALHAARSYVWYVVAPLNEFTGLAIVPRKFRRVDVVVEHARAPDADQDVTERAGLHSHAVDEVVVEALSARGGVRWTAHQRVSHDGGDDGVVVDEGVRSGWLVDVVLEKPARAKVGRHVVVNQRRPEGGRGVRLRVVAPEDRRV